MLLGIVFATLATFTGIYGEDAPEIDTPLGRIRGYYRTSYKGRKFAAFESIPYASPPIGELRFKEPQKVNPWPGTLQAREQQACMQVNMLGGPTGKAVSGHEDCLYLNVYTPRETPKATDNLDVVVHIHGGAFLTGTSHQAQPTLLMDREFVVVTINYRLGIFGFMCVEDEDMSCNNGLKDQVLALKWIQENIKHFGGNPDSVTITGMSAGGASVHYHYLSPVSAGLFHRGFSMSGAATNPWALQRHPNDQAQLVAKYLGCSNSTSGLISCLRSRPANSIVSSTWELHKFLLFPLVPLAPVVEKEAEGAFLTDHPSNLLKSGKVNDIPWLNSATTDEGFLFVLLSNLIQHLDELNEKWVDVVPYILHFYGLANEEDLKVVADRIKAHYFNGTDVSKTNIETVGKLIGDRLILADFERVAELHSRAQKSPVYSLLVGYETPQSIVRRFLRDTKIPGAFHGDDLAFLFGAAQEKLTEADESVTEIYLNLLEAFVKTGKPIIEGVDWRAAGESEEVEYVFLKGPKDIRVGDEKNLGEREFWESLPLNEFDRLVAVKDEL